MRTCAQICNFFFFKKNDELQAIFVRTLKILIKKTSMKWIDFFNKVRKLGGLAFFDDHHRAGTIKYLFVMKDDTVKISGYYGAEEYDRIIKEKLLPNQNFENSPFIADVDISSFENKDFKTPVENVYVTFHKVTDPHRKPMNTTWKTLDDGRVRIDFVGDQVPVSYSWQENGELHPSPVTRTSFWISNNDPHLFLTEKERLHLLLEHAFIDHTKI